MRYFHVTWHILKYWEIGGTHFQQQGSEIKVLHPIEDHLYANSTMIKGAHSPLAVLGLDKNL